MADFVLGFLDAGRVCQKKKMLWLGMFAAVFQREKKGHRLWKINGKKFGIKRG